jgi:triacylglycerol lipase
MPPKALTSTIQRLAGLEAFPQPPLIRLRHPVVLMHGFGIGATFGRGGHMHPLAMHLRTCGVTAYAPNVAPYETVTARTKTWRRRLDRVLAETGAERVTMIGHSMGGLDARYMVSQMGLADRVAAIVTVATPHHGSHIAKLILDQPETVRGWLAELVDWIGVNTLDDATADSLRALTELTPSFVNETFNPAVPDHPDVRYWSYAGRAGKGTKVLVDPLMRFFNAQLYRAEGENDGFVSVQSARWGTFLGTVDAGHAQQVGMNAALNPGFDANAFYCSVVEMLAREGF